jgi:hypothetical protein
MAKYPNEIYEPRPKENRSGVVYDPNKKTVIFAEDIKALDDEVKAIETELGTNPRGNFDSVKAFLQYLLSKVKDYFTDLLDVPHSYQGQAGKVLKVKQTEDGLEFGEAGAKKFIDLEDTPSSYSEQAKKSLRVNSAETGLEFFQVFAGYQENVSLTSTPGNNVYSTGISINVLSGQKVFAIFSGHAYNTASSSSGPVGDVAIQDNGSDVHGVSINLNLNQRANQYLPVSVSVLLSPSTGSHTIRVRCRATGSYNLLLSGKLAVLVF